MGEYTALYAVVTEALEAFYNAEQSWLRRDQFLSEAAQVIDALEATLPDLTPSLFNAPLTYEQQRRVLEAIVAPLQTINRTKTDPNYNFVIPKKRRGDGWEYDEKLIPRDVLRELALVHETGTWNPENDDILSGTPFMPYYRRIAFEMAKIRVPLAIPDQALFRAHWIVGDHGTGKTNLLSHLINEQLPRVASGEASIVVIDSQNELIPQLAHHARFGGGGDLDGRLIYIEPDPEHPLALNMFDQESERFSNLSATDRETITRGAMQMTEFFLSSILEAETTSNMATVLRYLVEAVMLIPNATVFTLQELVADGGVARFRHDLAALAPESLFWLEHRLPEREFNVTRGAIRVRLDGFTADPLFRRMFKSPRNKLDLYQELQSSKVILINTNKGLLKNATEPFGRFFIAQLLKATEERMLVHKSTRLPVFAYVDESTDYIAREENIAELINKARKQLVSLTFAVQSEDDIRSPVVLAALRRAAVQTRLHRPGFARVTVDRQVAEVEVPYVAFDRMPQMTDRNWHNIMADMWERYTADVSEKPVKQADAPSVDNEDEDAVEKRLQEKWQ